MGEATAMGRGQRGRPVGTAPAFCLDPTAT